MGFGAFVVGQSTDEQLKTNFLRLLAEDIARERRRVADHILLKIYFLSKNQTSIVIFLKVPWLGFQELFIQGLVTVFFL